MQPQRARILQLPATRMANGLHCIRNLIHTGCLPQIFIQRGAMYYLCMACRLPLPACHKQQNGGASPLNLLPL
jgi:hypothetical protein